ncbi:MAG TPA: ABC transporter permease, partial [Spirochaetia bacterium]|nr:ABC transporter permease [Spirochaetia bacterium]
MRLPKFRLEKRLPPPLWFQILTPIIAVFVSLMISAIFLLFIKQNPIQAYAYMFKGAVGTRFAFLEMLVKATPLILTGVAVTLAFTAKFWNIGAEGQLYAGAFIATWVGMMNLSLPPILYVPVIIVAGFAGGALWAAIPGLLKARYKVDDVVTTLLMNYIMIYIVSAFLNGPWRNPKTMYPATVDIAHNAFFPKIIAHSRVHLGLVLALLAVVALYFIVKKTRLGFEIRATGANAGAASFLGINTRRTIVLVAILSGGIAGLSGVGEVAGIQYHLIQDLSPGYGYNG